MRRLLLALLTLATVSLTGCDQLGIESAAVVAARKEAEGKAIGAGCRHAARSVEQCYANNRRVDKAAVFAGWKEMNDYMRENNIEAVPAPAETTVAAASTDDEPERTDAAAGKAAEKGGDKAGDAAADKATDKPARKPAKSAAKASAQH
jgi:hypothetical protein